MDPPPNWPVTNGMAEHLVREFTILLDPSVSVIDIYCRAAILDRDDNHGSLSTPTWMETCRDKRRNVVQKRIQMIGRTRRFVFVLFGAMLIAFAAEAETGRDMLQASSPDEFLINVSAAKLWVALEREVKADVAARILVRNSEVLVLSWAVRISESRAWAASGDLKKNELAEVGQNGIALTTVCLVPSKAGTVMRIRRAYYGEISQPLLFHSRGVFESAFSKRLAQSLGVTVTER